MKIECHYDMMYELNDCVHGSRRQRFDRVKVKKKMKTSTIHENTYYEWTLIVGDVKRRITGWRSMCQKT